MRPRGHRGPHVCSNGRPPLPPRANDEHATRPRVSLCTPMQGVQVHHVSDANAVMLASPSLSAIGILPCNVVPSSLSADGMHPLGDGEASQLSPSDRDVLVFCSPSRI